MIQQNSKYVWTLVALFLLAFSIPEYRQAVQLGVSYDVESSLATVAVGVSGTTTMTSMSCPAPFVCTTVIPFVYHPADANRDGRINMSELTAYGSTQYSRSAADIWKYGGELYVWDTKVQIWIPFHPADTNKDLFIDMSEVTVYGNGVYATAAATIWKAGTQYTWNPSMYDWTTIIQATSDASVTSVSGQTIAINYDSKKKESDLYAQFRVTISGGTKGTYIYKNFGCGIRFIDQKGNTTCTGTVVSALSAGITSSGDNIGNGMYKIGPGQVVQFIISGTAPTAVMLAGTYYGTLQSINATPSGYSGDGYYMYVPANKTGTMTIIGETAPYVTGFNSSQPFIPGQKVVASGQRLQSTYLTIDNVRQSGVSLSVSNGGTQASFVLPKTITGGNHYLALVNDKGASNNVWFQVQGATASSSMVVLNPTAGEVVTYGKAYTINWGGMWSGNDIFDITEFNSDGKGLLASGITQTQAGCSGYGKGVCSYVWTPSVITSNYQIAIVRRGSSDVAYTGVFTVASSTVDTIPSGMSTYVAPFTGGSTSTSGMFTFTFTAGNNTLYLSKDPTVLVATSTTGSGLSASLSTLISSPDSIAGDGPSYYVIPPGSSRTFQLSGRISGASGSNGTVKVLAIYYGTTSAMPNTNKIYYGLGALQTTAIVVP